MTNIYMNHLMTDPLRRQHLFDGDLLAYSASAESQALVKYVAGLIQEAFDPIEDPQRAQFDLPVEAFVERVGPLKTLFTNSAETKELIRALLLALGCDPEETYFDVPRLRVVPHGDYLSSGVSYAYEPHRDTWYSSPPEQVNWWLPVSDLVPGRAMSFFPDYFDKAIANSSAQFDYQEWCENGRLLASSQIRSDERKHPLALEQVDRSSELRIAGAKADVLLFSAGHLHSTAANKTGLTRFSLDFRTVNVHDLRNNRGAKNVDAQAKGTTLGDFLKLADFSSIDIPV